MKLPNACPKPAKRPPKGPTPIRRSRPRPANAARKAREFARTFHSEARVKFVKTLPCCLSLDFGTPDDPIDNTHIEGDGAGRKADYDQIVPAKHSLHMLAHEKGWATVLAMFKLDHDDLERFAADTEKRWQKFAALAGLVP